MQRNKVKRDFLTLPDLLFRSALLAVHAKEELLTCDGSQRVTIAASGGQDLLSQTSLYSFVVLGAVITRSK